MTTIDPRAKWFDGRGEKWDNWMEKFLEYGWQRHPLDSGDFLFHTHDGKCVRIEVKSVQDCINLQHTRKELSLMIDQCDIPIFLVWGPWNRRGNDLILGSGYITMKHVLNMLQSFQNAGLRLDIPVTSRNHAFLRINQLYAYYQKPDEEHQSTLAKRVSGADKRISLLMGISGMSKALSRQLLEYFGSVDLICGASQSVLKTVPNIGDTRAKMIWKYFHEKEPIR